MVALAIAGGRLPVLGVIFGTGMVPLQPETLIPFGGIVVGGTMTAVSQGTRRACHALRDGLAQFEAGLALGLLPRDAAGELTGRYTAESLFPVLDQTTTVGVVTLPGAFIGVLLGGGSPAEAAAAQIVVLVGLIAAETVGVVTATRLVDSGRLLDAELRSHRLLWDYARPAPRIEGELAPGLARFELLQHRRALLSGCTWGVPGGYTPWAMRASISSSNAGRGTGPRPPVRRCAAP